MWYFSEDRSVQLSRIIDTFNPLSGVACHVKYENLSKRVVGIAGHRYVRCTGKAAGCTAGFRLLYAITSGFRCKLPFADRGGKPGRGCEITDTARQAVRRAQ